MLLTYMLNSIIHIKNNLKFLGGFAMRRTITIDEKIAKAQETVDKYKKKYEEAVEALKALEERKKQFKAEELLEAIESSGKSYDDIMSYLKSN